jgi:nitronate monooxygenase
MAIDLLKHFQMKTPIILAPLGGSPCTPELVSAVCNAGALGSIGAAYMDSKTILEFTKKVRAQTQRPFVINLFTPAEEYEIAADTLENAFDATAGYRNELKIPEPKTFEPPYTENFDQQFEAVLSLKPAAFSFVFGQLEKKYLQACRDQKIIIMGTATTVEEALALEDDGVDAIILQGVEAGGHRGIFDAEEDDPQITTVELVRAAHLSLETPLIAAGGIMTGKDINNIMKAGAIAAQLGTAFLACDEAGTSGPYRQALLAKDAKTALTRVFSGRIARGVVNRFMEEMEDEPEAVLPYPAQNRFTRDLRKASIDRNSSDFLSLWAGTGVNKIRTGKAADILNKLFLELQAELGAK